MENDYYISVIPYTSIGMNDIKTISCEPRMYRIFGNKTYLAELPLASKDKKISNSLYYIYDELNDEEQERYIDKVISLPVTIKEVVPVYSEEAKSFFPKLRSKKKTFKKPSKND